MKNIKRLLLIIVALIIGGILGYFLLVDFEPLKLTFWIIACIVLGYLLNLIDKKFNG